MLKIIIFTLLVSLNYALAQTKEEFTDSSKTFTLSIHSNLNNANIFLDTMLIGQTPLINYTVTKGFYNIKVINPKSSKNWAAENKIIPAIIKSDTTINANFQYYYSINTIPFDAIVFKKDSALGITPLRFFSDIELSGTLILKKKNYMDYIYDLKSYDFETGATLTLKPKGKEIINDLVYKNRGTQFKTKRDIITISGLGLAAITGGYMAINFKNKANNAYDKYLSDANQDELNISNRNDTYFTVSLILMQAAIGGLIYFLFFDK
jgi:hypothetical protein